jgi:hypothetical protein
MIEKTTVGMQPEDRHSAMAHVMGSLGNLNIRGHHLKFFEDKILESGENRENDVTNAPNYVAWLFLMTDYLFWEIRSVCYRYSDFDHDLFDLSYNRLIEVFFVTCEKLGKCSHIDKDQIAAQLISLLDLRHTLIHKGYPNLLPITMKRPGKKPAIEASGSVNFDADYTKRNMSYYSDPRNFVEINTKFKTLLSFVLKGPPVSIGF